MVDHRLDRPPLHPVVPRPGRVRRQETLRTLRVQEQVRRIAASIHRRTAEFRQPDRLHPRHPGRRHRRPHPARPIVMRVRPPAGQILGPKHPVLAMGRIHDRRPHLRRPIGIIRIEPVEPVPARDLRRQIGRVRRHLEHLSIDPAVAAPPVSQRRIPVDPDVIDVRIGPQRIEMKRHRPVLRPMPEILRPVRRIGQAHPWPRDRPALGRQRPVLIHRRMATCRIARPGQPTHLRPDQQPVTPRLRRQCRIVPRQPSQPPSIRRPEQARDLSRRARSILAPQPPPPRMRRLLGPAIGIGQTVPCGHIHEHERIKRDHPAACLQRRHALPHRLVRRRPTIGWPPIDLADQMRRVPPQPRHRPAQRLGWLVPPLHPRFHDTMPSPEVCPKPPDHQTDPLQIGQLRRQLIQRHDQIRPPLAVIQVLGPRPRQPLAPHHRLGRQHKLPRPRDQTYALQLLLQPIPLGPSEHFKTQLRRSIAVRSQRQILEHHIGRPTIGRSRPL